MQGFDPAGTSPYTQYLAAQGLLGERTFSPAEGYRRGMYEPLRSIYGLEQTLAPALGSTPGLWQNYMGGFGDARSLPGNIYNRASALLRGLYGLGGAGREAAGVGFSPQYLEGDEVIPPGVSQAQQSALFSQALRPQFGFQGAQRFASRLPVEQNLWEQQAAVGGGGGGGGTFLDWIRDKYNLGRFFGTQTGGAAVGGGMGQNNQMNPTFPTQTVSTAPPPAAAGPAATATATSASVAGPATGIPSSSHWDSDIQGFLDRGEYGAALNHARSQYESGISIFTIEDVNALERQIAALQGAMM
jgi:hypothetical protein